MMNPYSMMGSRATLRRLLIAATFGALLGASGCGRAESPAPIDSETHWLMSCESNLDCAAGSCEYGVCTQTCSSNDECSVLGVPGVECVGESGDPGAAGSACLLPCVDDDDCNALGSGAVCQSQRCELPASAVVDGAGSAGAASLCDGSEDVRFLWSQGEGDIIPTERLAESRGSTFLAIDGQCRFWRANGSTLPVFSGTLSSDRAAAFEALVYDRFAELSSYNDDVPCISDGLTRLWAPVSRAVCNCACSEKAELGGWLSLAEAMRTPQVQDSFADAQPVTGPLRLVLLGYQGDLDALSPYRRIDGAPFPWPLSRAPAENEVYYVAPGEEPPVPDESSGADVVDPNERAALRATQQAFIERGNGGPFTPLDYIDPDTQQLTFLRMLLRDELPAHVQAALDRPLF
jgi:hypothetical protein